MSQNLRPSCNETPRLKIKQEPDCDDPEESAGKSLASDQVESQNTANNSQQSEASDKTCEDGIQLGIEVTPLRDPKVEMFGDNFSNDGSHSSTRAESERERLRSETFNLCEERWNDFGEWWLRRNRVEEEPYSPICKTVAKCLKYQCTKCNYNFVTERSLRQHEVICFGRKRRVPSDHVPKPSPKYQLRSRANKQNLRSYTCSKCDFSSLSEKNVQVHENFCIANAESKFKCDECGHNCISKSGLDQHKHFSHGKIVSIPSKAKFHLTKDYWCNPDCTEHQHLFGFGQ